MNITKKNKIAVLTGGTSYIGQRLNQQLLSDGWQTILIVRPTNQTARLIANATDNCKLVEYDGNQESLTLIQVQAGADVVFFHLATHSGFNGLASNLDQLIDSNIRFGVHLMEYMIKNGHRNLIVAESYWQYDSNGQLGGNTLYAVSKSAFGLLAEYYSKNLNIISLVLYDVYGPFDNRGKLINSLINGALVNVPVDMTPGEQSMDYVYIDDVIQAFEIAGTSLLKLCGDRKNGLSRYTVRTMEVRKLREFVGILGEVMGRLPLLRWGAKPYPSHQIMNPWFPSSAFQLPGWMPKFNFYSGIAKVIEHEQC